MYAAKTEKIAFFKLRPGQQIPKRPGAIQCIKNCSRCLSSSAELTKDEFDLEILSLSTYDNFLLRKRIWFTPYQSVQYHLGQIEILKTTMKRDTSIKTLFILATDNPDDLILFNDILSFKHLPTAHKVDNQNILGSLEKFEAAAILVKFKSCPDRESFFGRGKRRLLDEFSDLNQSLRPLVTSINEKQNTNFNIVIIVVTKDHDNLVVPGIGSMCFNILEPYTERRKAEHFISHLYYDITRGAGILAPHVVAFLILYLNREDGVTLEDLTEYMEFFRKISIELDMQFAFTGSSHHAVKFGLEILRKYIRNYGQTYSAMNHQALVEYADLVTPLVAYQGLISHAIMMVYNDYDCHTNKNLAPSMRVNRDDVLETSQFHAKELEDIVPCRRPCLTSDLQIQEVFDYMCTSRHYFKIEEPKIKQRRPCAWAGESDDDEEYFLENQDNPAFQTWIVLSEKPDRIDKLNLFMNATKSCTKR